MPTHPYTSRLVPLAEIDTNPDQPRKVFDPTAQAELMASIKERGLLSAIALMDVGGGRFRVLAGERRFRACQELGWTEIDARIWPADTPALEIELMGLVENLQRQDLNPIEIAQGCKRLALPPFELTQEEIAEKLGISDRTSVARYLGLLDMPAKIQESVARTTLSMAHCRTLKRLGDESAQIQLAEKAASEGWSVKETDKRVTQWLTQNGASGQSTPNASTALESDPYGDFWPSVLLQPTLQELGRSQMKYRKGIWSLELTPVTGEPMDTVVEWYTRMAPLLASAWKAKSNPNDQS